MTEVYRIFEQYTYLGTAKLLETVVTRDGYRIDSGPGGVSRNRKLIVRYGFEARRREAVLLICSPILQMEP